MQIQMEVQMEILVRKYEQRIGELTVHNMVLDAALEQKQIEVGMLRSKLEELTSDRSSAPSAASEFSDASGEPHQHRPDGSHF
jgi:hypothetical protein